MYHQQQGSQPFPNAPHHQPSANQHPNHPNMQAMGFQFPRPNQLPDELESALAIRGTRDMDHRQIDHMNQPNQQQNQGPGTGQHGSYGSNPILLPSDNQPGHQQGVDWSNYQPPAKLFVQTQQQPPSGQAGGRMPNWNPPIRDSSSPQTRQPLGDGGRVEGPGLYTPESAGSILASFGLSNEDLEVLSHYPDDQLTPDTLPFILRDIQLNKSGKQTAVSSTSSSSYSHNVPPSGSSHSTEVPSLLTVTQTAGKVIDYGHASRGTEESGTRETFKREPLSSERAVKMLPTATSSSAPKVDKTERRQVRLEHKEPSKHGDIDYRKSSGEKRKNSRSPAREFAPLPKSRNLDRDYRQVESKPRPPSETRSEDSSRRSLSSSSASRQHGSSKKFPTHSMISDFAGMSPKVYPHTCSLCHIQCDHIKEWIYHINTVDHTAACRDLRNKYPDWKPNQPSRSGRYGSRAVWDPKDGSPLDSIPHSRSRSPTSPQGKFRREPYVHRPHGRPYSPPRHSRPHYHTEQSHWIKHHHSGSHAPHYPHQTSPPSRESWPDKRNRESAGGYPHRGVKRPHDALTKGSGDTSRNAASSGAGHGSKQGPPKPSPRTTKAAPKTALKTTKMAVKTLPVKKKKKVAAPASQGMPFADRLVYLTGIPVDATEQEVTDLVGSFGKINNVILLPCSEEESEKGQGQKASVCMMKAEDAQALASASKLCIRDQEITTSVAKKPNDGQLSDANSKADAEKDKESAGNGSGGETDQKTSEQQKWKVLITGLPDSGWSESDIAQLVQSFGTPSDIILAKHIGKALISFADLEVAEELVKVHGFKPVMFKDTEVKMRLVKQQIGLGTPVALYNLLTGSLDPLEGPAPVGWNSLVVIRNVPDTPAASTEVLKLMRRFGTVIKSLVVNNMIICEMATTAMALSVYKRFLMFPCIIQNNPLIFYRKADPRAHPQTKIIPAYCDTSEDKPADNSQAAAEPLEQDGESHQDNCEVQLEEDGDEQAKTEEKTEEENLTEKESKDDSVKEEELGVSVSSPPSDAKPDKDAAEAENTDVTKDVGASELENVEEANAPSSTEESAPAETAMPELPKMTQAMVNALLVECRTRTAINLNKTATPPCGDQEQAKQEEEDQEKTADGTKDSAKNATGEKDEEVKKEERERKEREAKKEKERKERERREKERRERRERAEKASKDNERRERERRERRRGYDERSSGSRSSYRPGGHRHSWRDERHRGEAERRKDQPEEDHSDEFPFNLSDFVTVDELGDVTDLPDPAVPMETSDEGDAARQTEQQEENEDTSVETTATQEAQFDEKVSESEPVVMATPQSLNNMGSGLDLKAAEPLPAASHIDIAPGETEGQPEASIDDMKSEPDTTLASSLNVGPISTSDSQAGAATAEGEEESRRSSPVNHSEAQNNEVMDASNKQHNEENMDEAPEPETSGVHSEAAPEPPVVLQTDEPQKAKDDTGIREESGKKPLPPYDPNKAVGLEYLVPKTGFFCKVCSRFFTGAKAAEINHCKTVKHYENLQKFLQNPKSSSAAVKTDSS